jgi:SRSO17 transposase
MTSRQPTHWKQELARWLAPFLAAPGHRALRRWAPVYLRGLLAAGERKSVRPLATRVAPADGEQRHHFVCASWWEPASREGGLAGAGFAGEVQRPMGDGDAVLVVDDTTLPEQDHDSVGRAHRYSSRFGRNPNCQALVSPTLARGEVPVPVALRLFLPAEWTADPARCRPVGVPAAPPTGAATPWPPRRRRWWQRVRWG